MSLNHYSDAERDRDVFTIYIPMFAGAIGAEAAHIVSELSDTSEIVTAGSAAAAAAVGFVAVRKLICWAYDKD
jgi:undecaprenyl pyrophosphate phosphatase UppP